MPKFALTYFDLPGRAEPIRLAFSIGKIQFEDKRIGFEQWYEFKEQTKFGQLPLLEVDQKQYAQSRAILKYVGRITGLYPQTYEDQFEVDEGIDLVDDMIQKIIHVEYEIEEEKAKLEAKKKLQDEILPALFNCYEKQIKEGKSGFYGKKLSVTDLYLYTVINWVTSGAIDNVKYNIDQHKLLAKLRNAVAVIPEVQTFEAKHYK